MSSHFYITTTLPYVNSDPHIGFAMEVVRADIIARYKKLLGFKVFFNTGTDEHGVKIYNKAKEAGKDTQAYVDEYAAKFKDLKKILGLSEDIHFIRTTDAHHIAAAEEFWKLCDKNGYIYKKNYSIKYCIGCELEKTDSELVNGRCPLHPNQDIELIQEENYFFAYSKFQERLLKLYKERPDFVLPSFRFTEIISFVERGLTDFSISRLTTKMPWGIPVPGDSSQVMYVWFDALVSYIATIGWPKDKETFETWWPVTQYCGKDNLRQQSATWQAMLMAANLPPSQQIIINGFITGEGGLKMSKSIGNVVNPLDIVNEYGTEALRYYVARELSPFEDSPFTMERFKESYNASLANGIGNLTSRILKMVTANNISVDALALDNNFRWTLHPALEKFDIKAYADEIWADIADLDKSIQTKQPFKLIKTDKAQGEAEIRQLVLGLHKVATKLLPLLPHTAETVLGLVREHKMPEVPLFLRKD